MPQNKVNYKNSSFIISMCYPNYNDHYAANIYRNNISLDNRCEFAFF